MKIWTDEEIIEKFESWAEKGRWIGIFENHDLGHPMIGRRIALPFPDAQWSKGSIGKSKAPDGKHGPGFRWILVGKTRKPQEALEMLMKENE